MPMFDRLHTEPVYNTRAVVQRTGVPADTIRAWERRYGSPSPCRTTGNQRLYSEKDLALICWLRDQTRAGMTISQAVALYDSMCREDDMRAAQRELAEAYPAPTARPVVDAVSSENETGVNGARNAVRSRATLARICGDIVDALSNFDDQRAEQVIEELLIFTAIEEVSCHIFEPVFDEMRSLRERGAISAGAEQFARSFVMRKISALFNLSRPHTGRGPVVVAGVQGEQREVCMLISALCLSRHGYHVVYLGPNLQPSEVATATRLIGARLVMLSVSEESSIDALTEAAAVIEHSDANAPIVGYIGRIFGARPDLCRRINARFLGADGPSTVASVDRLLGVEQAASVLSI